MSNKVNNEDDLEIDPYQVIPYVRIKKMVSRKFVNRFALSVVLVLAIVTTIFGGYQFWYLRQVNPPGDPGAAEIFTVTESDDLLVISTPLFLSFLTENYPFIPSIRNTKSILQGT